MAQAITTFFSSGPGGWGQLFMKHGPAWVLLAYLIYFLTNGVGAEVSAMRADHQQLGFYLRAICVGINADRPNGWQQCTPPDVRSGK